MKKIIGITFALLLFCFVSIDPASAMSHVNHEHVHHDHVEQEHVANENINADGEVGILYVPCPEGGKHIMRPRGTGAVFIGSKRVLNGQSSQCEKCGDVIISEFNPFNPATTKLGSYGYANYPYTISPGTYMYTNKLYYNSSLNDSFGQSFVWKF